MTGRNQVPGLCDAPLPAYSGETVWAIHPLRVAAGASVDLCAARSNAPGHSPRHCPASIASGLRRQTARQLDGSRGRSLRGQSADTAFCAVNPLLSSFRRSGPGAWSAATGPGTLLMNGGVAPRAARRPDRQARGGRMPGAFDRRATPRGGMHRRPNAGPIHEKGSKLMQGRSLPLLPPVLICA